MKPIKSSLLYAAFCLGAALPSQTAPLITTHPWHQAVEEKTSVTFRVAATGDGPLAFQWRLNGADVPGATNPVLTVPAVEPGSAGKYTAVVTGASGSVTSEVARLAVHVPIPLLALTNHWKFNQSGEDLGASWRESGYDDSAWTGGSGLLYNETRTLPVPKSTVLSLTNAAGKPITTYYFRTRFDLPVLSPGLLLVATTWVDDGAVFYLNGRELGRLRLPSSPIDFTIPAIVAVEGTPDVMLWPGDGLVAGVNVLAVEVHQQSVTVADVVFGMTLRATTLPPLLPDLVIPTPPTPHIELQTFATSHCEVLEGCATPGNRRLLRFDIEARNAGTGDMVLGNPVGNPQFVLDPCHNHYHYDDFARFRLLDADGNLAAGGKKIGFGLADVDRWDTTNAAPNPRFDGSTLQGVSRGWSDIYSHQVACQYVDITGVPPGAYLLELEADPENKIPELDESNNITYLPVEIPADWSPCTAPPSNDDFDHAEIIPPLSTTTVYGSTECATLQPGEPRIQDSFDNRGVRSIWFKWTAPATGGLTLDTVGSTFPTVLGLYRGAVLTNLIALGGDADFTGPARTSRVMASVVGGETYAIAVDGYYDARGFVQRDTFGSVTLNLHLNTNDTFLAAQHVEGLTGSVAATPFGATKEAGEPNHAGDPGGRSLWYMWTAPQNGTMVFDTYGSTFNRGWRGQNNTLDTVLAVYTGDRLDSLSLVNSNDDANVARLSRVEFVARAGTSYYLAVDTRAGPSASGYARLNWRPRLRLLQSAVSGESVSFNLLSDREESTVIESSPDLRTWTTMGEMVISPSAAPFRDKPGITRFYRARVE